MLEHPENPYVTSKLRAVWEDGRIHGVRRRPLDGDGVDALPPDEPPVGVVQRIAWQAGYRVGEREILS